MQPLLVVWVTLLASCYSPSIRDCMLTCAAGNKCPNGLECHDNYCREPGATDSCVGDAGPDMMVDGAPDVDTDMDGFNDAVDNCRAISNIDQANEDGDAFGDVCDPCPPSAEAADNLDSDGDKVGDGCDPFPNDSGGERIVLFVGFETAPSVQEAVRVGQNGAWSFGNGRARVTTLQDSFAGLVWNLSPGVDGRFYVSSHMELIGFRPSNMARGAGVVAAYDPGSDQSAACVLGLNASGGAPALMLLDTTLTNDTILAETLNVVGNGAGMTSDITVNRQVGSTSFRCSTPTTAVGGDPTVAAGGVRQGLRARGVTAEFDWVMIVESNP